MKKYLFQNIFQSLLYILVGAIFVGTLLDAVSNAISLITPRIALILTIIVILIFFTLHVIAKYKGISWKSGSQSFIIKKPNRKVNLFFVGVLVLIWFPVLIYNYSNESGQHIAEKPDEFKKGEIAFSLGNTYISENVQDSILLVYGTPKTYAKVDLFGHLPIAFHNFGRKSVENAIIYLKMSKLITVSDSIIKVVDPIFKSTNREVRHNEAFNFFNFSIETINPGMGANLNEFFRLACTDLSSTFPVKTKDKTWINIYYHAEVEAPIEVGLTAKDYQSQKYQFRYQRHNAECLDSLIQNRYKYLIRNKSKFISYKRYIPIAFIYCSKIDTIINQDNVVVLEAKPENYQIKICNFDKQDNLMYELVDK